MIVFHCINIPQFVYPIPVEGHLCHIQSLTITNTTATNIHIQVFVWMYAFHFSWKIPSADTAGLDSRCIFTYLKTAKSFSKVVAPFYSPEYCMKFPRALLFLRCLILSIFLTFSPSTVFVVLWQWAFICHLFIFFGEVSFKFCRPPPFFSPLLKIEWFYFLLLSFKSYLFT